MYRWTCFALVCALAAAVPLDARGRRPARKGVAHRMVEPPQFDPAAIQNAQQTDILGPDAKGSAVVRAQILLDRQHFSCGEIDGHYGINLQKTVTAFQQDRKLPVSGTVDMSTWGALNQDTAPVLLVYTITPEDEKGPFVRVPGELMEQAKLPALGYQSPLEELAEKFHSSTQLLEALNPGKNFTKAGEQITVPNTIVSPPGQAANVAVSKSESSVRAYDATGKLLAYYSATIGSEHDPLPIGEWKILGVAHNPVFHYNAKYFWDAKNPNDQAKIAPGPNNPAGLVWIDLNKEHYGIHGTPDPAKVGHVQSHGCIRLTNWDALELASMVKPGTPAILKE